MRSTTGKSQLVVTACPTCGSRAIRTYTVKDLEYYSCPNCGEKVYPPEAMRRLQEASPA
jgi:predicted RNA-binding Zn-ribbon protein involved in translation (DUF1610 family)